MKKILINFEYNIPEKKESFSLSKFDVISQLIEEKAKMADYLEKKQNEINALIDDLIKGSNITDAENFLLAYDPEEKYKKFVYIGESKQNKINEIYELYSNIIKGFKIYGLVSSSEIFSDKDVEFLLSESLKTDLNKLNEILKKENINKELKIEKICKDIDYYEKDLINIINELKEQVCLKIV